MIFAAVIIAASLLIFWLVLNSDLSGLIKFVLVSLEMLAVSFVLAKKYKLDTELGFILIKSKKGIDAINELAKSRRLWDFFADAGTTISYGLLGALIMRKNTNIASFAVGMILLAVISFVVAPLALHFLSAVITGSVFESKASVSFGDAQTTAGIFVLILLFGGFFLMLLVGILYYGTHIALLLFQFLFFGSQVITTTQPGGTLLLPGINLPFIEGVLALVVILIVHEGCHAILARIAGVPIISSGVVLFGIIPVGAFVEPDEKLLRTIPQKEQTRVYVAGSAANFITSVIFLLLFIPVAFALNWLAAGPLYDALHFVYFFLGLTFSINFVVATVNLLPLPLFDGYRVLELNIPHKAVVNALMYITLIAFLFNFLPWLFVH